MALQRRYKVTTTVTQYMWASSRADAAKFQEELIRKERLRLQRDGETEVKFCFGGGENYLEAPEDISKTRNPIDEPRKLDWVEYGQGDNPNVALITRISRRKIYYFESESGIERSIDSSRWADWASRLTIHPSYEETLPAFIIKEVIDEHQKRGILSGYSATPDSSLILEILEKYGYIPDDYEVENGYWAENLLDALLSERILTGGSKSALADDMGVDEHADFGVSFSQELPSFDEFDK
jgi:hypothetical protein